MLLHSDACRMRVKLLLIDPDNDVDVGCSSVCTVLIVLGKCSLCCCLPRSGCMRLQCVHARIHMCVLLLHMANVGLTPSI
jgi:hypothetical protein